MEREVENLELELCETFLAREADRMSLPIRLGGGNRPMIELGHWADGSSRNSFKLYAGNRSAATIARAMLLGVHLKPKKNKTVGDLKTKGVRQLWEDRRDELIAHPLEVLTPMGGSLTSIRAVLGPQSMPDTRLTIRVIKSPHRPWLNFSRPGVWRMLAPSAKRDRSGMPYGAFLFLPYWPVLLFAAPTLACR